MGAMMLLAVVVVVGGGRMDEQAFLQSRGSFDELQSHLCGMCSWGSALFIVYDFRLKEIKTNTHIILFGKVIPSDNADARRDVMKTIARVFLFL